METSMTVAETCGCMADRVSFDVTILDESNDRPFEGGG